MIRHQELDYSLPRIHHFGSSWRLPSCFPRGDAAAVDPPPALPDIRGTRLQASRSADDRVGIGIPFRTSGIKDRSAGGDGTRVRRMSGYITHCLLVCLNLQSKSLMGQRRPAPMLPDMNRQLVRKMLNHRVMGDAQMSQPADGGSFMASANSFRRSDPLGYPCRGSSRQQVHIFCDPFRHRDALSQDHCEEFSPH